ncbi:MAG: MoxR family ATPase [Candidatus Micrarchaeota archaeon]|nr:MoxR family ATPase [Candidatus Micrarchaeota archaeon]
MDPAESFKAVKEELAKHIAGKQDLLELIFISLVANGHAMLEGVPGVAKTTTIKTLAEAVDINFARIQGMPDLDIRDIIGNTYVDERNEIQLKRGPIFTNLLLIDELNRAPPKTTTALLEALEERQVTIGNETMPLDRPFIAFATQNPLNIEGTNPLPKVLADRFLMRIAVNYQSMEDEELMLRIKEKGEKQKVEKVLTKEQVLQLQEMVSGVTISDQVVEYITRVVNATRTDIHMVMGASPRAEISFMQAGKARALIQGRKEVSIDDVKFLARPILSHRIVVRATGGLGVNGIIDGIIATVK